MKINIHAFTGLMFQKAASKWSCGGEQGHNGTLNPLFFSFPLQPTSAQDNRGLCLGTDELRMLHDVLSLAFNETMCQGEGFCSLKRG